MKIVKVFKAIAGILSLVIWFSSFQVFDHYDRVNPTKPDVATGRIYDQQNHGHTVYLTADEKFNWRARMVLAGVLFGIAGLLHLHIRSVERSKTRPKDLGNR